jgi:hypothetical protein
VTHRFAACLLTAIVVWAALVGLAYATGLG